MPGDFVHPRPCQLGRYLELLSDLSWAANGSMPILHTNTSQRSQSSPLDERSLGLAPNVVERLLPVMSAYARESGCAVLLDEQNIQIALAVADHGYVLSHGELDA